MELDTAGELGWAWGTRSAWNRVWRVALLISLGVTPNVVQAATIYVGNNCSLAEAITAANDDNAVGACPAGQGRDRVVLEPGSLIVLTEADNDFEGGTGLPVITEDLTIDGRGSAITRDPSAEPFRILAVDDYADLTLRNTRISGGDSITDGGGLNAYDGGSITIERCVFTGNRAAERGGGVFIGTSGTISETVIVDNEAGERGGGVAHFFGSLTIERSTLTGNAAGSTGGGLYSMIAFYVDVVNTTISGNLAEQGGGLAFAEGWIDIVASTITGNVAEVGGGLHNPYYSASVRQSIISGNEAPVGPEGVSVLMDTEQNIFGQNGDVGFVGFSPGPTNIVPVGSVATVLEPGLTFSGGLTPVHRLAEGSPALDALPHGTCEEIDQRGVSRPQGAACDLGAYELVPDLCVDAEPSAGCTVNGVPDQPCIGTTEADIIVGTTGDDVILGLGGPDRLEGAGGADLLCGGDGPDVLLGGPGDDRLFGGPGSDVLAGGEGIDLFDGGPDDNTCYVQPREPSVISCE